MQVELKEYVVKHILFHNGERHRRGSLVQLDAKDALPLLAEGIIDTATSVPVIVTLPPVKLGEATLGKLNLVELQEQAKAFGIDVEGLDKAALIGLIVAAPEVVIA